MNNAEVVLAGLLETRDSTIDKFTADIGARGMDEASFRSLSDKWALDSWTEVDDGAVAPILEGLESSKKVSSRDGKFSLTPEGKSELLATVRQYLRSPKRLSQFTVGLALSGLLAQDEVTDCLEGFRENLVASIKGNSEKAAAMRGTPFEDVMSLTLAQLEATKSWLDVRLNVKG